MKPLTYILSAVILVMGWLLFQQHLENSKYRELERKVIEGLKRENLKQKDSLVRVVDLTRDSLDIAFNTILLAKKESQEARERSQKTIRDLQKIIYIQHTDSSRTAVLKTLYKSYTP
ncbi:MAG TPA: hypothetical protein VFU05_02435 [Cyclobacteriaceae bacterium]|nr:hypothetical protein [Cyclobacteriaceae bacterium]